MALTAMMIGSASSTISCADSFLSGGRIYDEPRLELTSGVRLLIDDHRAQLELMVCGEETHPDRADVVDILSIVCPFGSVWSCSLSECLLLMDMSVNFGGMSVHPMRPATRVCGCRSG